jgi:hypothetical protein
MRSCATAPRLDRVWLTIVEAAPAHIAGRSGWEHMTPLTTTRRWLAAQLKTQAKRDEDLDTWWQLPDDRTRTASPWRQLAVDVIAPATFSVWHRTVAESRVVRYDRLRPPITRLVFLVGVTAGIAALDAPAWIWIMLIPATVQVGLEILIHRYLPESAPQPRWKVIRTIRDIFLRTYGELLLNVTGLIGTIACPLLIVAIAEAPAGGDDLGWVKVGALAAAIFYLNSGLTSVFLDPPNYTETSAMPAGMHTVRPFAPLLSLIVVTAIVAVSVDMDRWQPEMIPLAYLCAGLTLLLGSTIRNHDRNLAAAIVPARHAIEAGREDLGRVIHDQFGPIKAAAEGAAQIPQMPFEWANDLAVLPALLTHFHTRTGLYETHRMELDYLASRILEPYGIWEDVTYEFRWGHLRPRDHQIAVSMATALLNNIGQALSKPAFRDCPRAIVMEGFTTGSGRGLTYHFAVRDHLPLIGDWCPPGRSLTELRTMLRTNHNGDLIQERLDDTTKRIVASWADRTPKAAYGDPFPKDDR